jgi:TniQ
MLLPRPYPDELIGSALARGCRQYGLSAKLLLREIVGPGRTTFSFVMASELKVLAASMGMDAYLLLSDHTVFPYATAFMPGQMKRELIDKAMRLSRTESIGPLSKVVTHGVAYRRLCPVCVEHDLKTWGEAYWHRVHNLPGVLLCVHHECQLKATNVQLRGRSHSAMLALPDGVDAEPEILLPNSEAMRTVTQLSVVALQGNVVWDGNSAAAYRQAALFRGYELNSRNIATRAFTEALLELFGTPYMKQAGCEYQGRPVSHWPALMLRPGVDIQFATPKHILLQTFLKCGKSFPSNAKADYQPPGPHLPDFQSLDCLLVQRLCEIVVGVQLDDGRITLKEVMRLSGLGEIFRHHSRDFPLTVDFLNEFKRSDFSERQVGGRPCWRLRHPSRYPTTAKAEL